MKTIELTQGKVALVDDADYKWLSQWNWGLSTHPNIFYAKAWINSKATYMHRLILGLTDRKIHTDHKDHNGLNNQRDNLRRCTSSENQKNARASGKSKYLGVSFYTPQKDNKHKRFKNGKPYKSNRWKASFHIGKKLKFLGYFETQLEAAIIYNIAARKYHGEFANPNKFN